MFKKTLFATTILFAFILHSCTKDTGGSGNNISSTDVSMKNIGGNYRNGIIKWNYSNASTIFEDANTNFDITYTDSTHCSLVLNTKIPITKKSYNLLLTNKVYSPVTATSNGVGYGYYTYDDSSISLRVFLDASPTGFSDSALIYNSGVNNTSVYFQGNGFK